MFEHQDPVLCHINIRKKKNRTSFVSREKKKLKKYRKRKTKTLTVLEVMYVFGIEGRRGNLWV